MILVTIGLAIITFILLTALILTEAKLQTVQSHLITKNATESQSILQLTKLKGTEKTNKHFKKILIA